MSTNGWRVVYRLSVLLLTCYMTAMHGPIYWLLLPIALLNPTRIKRQPRPENMRYPDQHDT